MHPDFKDFQAKFQVSDLEIYRTKHWVWSVRPVHATIGAGILSAAEYHPKFSDMGSDGMKDLDDIVSVIENTLGDTFEYDKMNYLMLMMVDLHVHFHVIPRYSKNITFNGSTWEDSGWPALPSLGDGSDTDREMLLKIRDVLKAKIA